MSWSAGSPSLQPPPLKSESYPRVERVILSEERRGTGTEEDPVRMVLVVHTEQGELLAVAKDPTWLRQVEQDQRLLGLTDALTIVRQVLARGGFLTDAIDLIESVRRSPR